MEITLVDKYVELFKKSQHFNLLMLGMMSGVCITSIAVGLLISYFSMADLMGFLSAEVFGSILIGYYSYTRIRKLGRKNKKVKPNG